VEGGKRHQKVLIQPLRRQFRNDYDADGCGDLNKSEFASKLFAFAVCERPVTGESGEIDEIGHPGEQRGQAFGGILERARSELA
jgi:hypothetical protein